MDKTIRIDAKSFRAQWDRQGSPDLRAVDPEKFLKVERPVQVIEQLPEVHEAKFCPLHLDWRLPVDWARVASTLEDCDADFGHAKMNATERKFAMRLEALRKSGEIQAWGFETLSLLWSPHHVYTPDFPVVTNGRVVIYEVKGHLFPQDRMRYLGVQQAFGVKIQLCRLVKGQWHHEFVK